MKVNINKATIRAKIDGAFHKGLGPLSEIILNDCNEYCKWDQGALNQSSYTHSKPQEGLLIWETPYARRQYWEIKTAYPDVKPNATWKWCEVAKRLHFSQWERQAQKYFEENLK